MGEHSGNEEEPITENQETPEPETTEGSGKESVEGSGEEQGTVGGEPTIGDEPESSGQEETIEDDAGDTVEKDAGDAAEDAVEEDGGDAATEDEGDGDLLDDKETPDDEEDETPALPTPSAEECLGILKEQGAPQELIEHSMAVAELAQKICDMYDLHNDKKCDSQLVAAGALLHDIGRVKTHDISHNIDGSGILKELGYSKEL